MLNQYGNDFSDFVCFRALKAYNPNDRACTFLVSSDWNHDSLNIHLKMDSFSTGNKSSVISFVFVFFLFFQNRKINLIPAKVCHAWGIDRNCQFLQFFCFLFFKNRKIILIPAKVCLVIDRNCQFLQQN